MKALIHVCPASQLSSVIPPRRALSLITTSCSGKGLLNFIAPIAWMLCRTSSLDRSRRYWPLGTITMCGMYSQFFWSRRGDSGIVSKPAGMSSSQTTTFFTALDSPATTRRGDALPSCPQTSGFLVIGSGSRAGTSPAQVTIPLRLAKSAPPFSSASPKTGKRTTNSDRETKNTRALTPWYASENQYMLISSPHPLLSRRSCD